MRPASWWEEETGSWVAENVPFATARFVHTGLVDRFGRPILKLRSKPVGFRANLDGPPLYVVDDDTAPDHGIIPDGETEDDEEDTDEA